MCNFGFGFGIALSNLSNVVFFLNKSPSNSKLSNFFKLISIFRSSNEVIINNPHGLHGLIETIIVSIQGATSFVKFGTLGCYKFYWHLWFIWFSR